MKLSEKLTKMSIKDFEIKLYTIYAHNVGDGFILDYGITILVKVYQR